MKINKDQIKQDQLEEFSYKESIRSTIHFDPPNYNQLFNLPEGARPVPDAANWFFIRFTARTGSTIFSELLSLHPDVDCTNEADFIATVWPILITDRLSYAHVDLGQKYLAYRGGIISWDLYKFRGVMESIRSAASAKQFYGDKTGFIRFGAPEVNQYNALFQKAFPNAKYFLMVRSPLDQVSSWINKNWALVISDNKEKRIADIHDKLKIIYRNNVYAKPHSDLILEFEKFFTKDSMTGYLREAFSIIGANPSKYDYEEAWEACKHKGSYQRWKDDEQIAEYLDWLKETNNYELHNKLINEEYYLDKKLLAEVWGEQ